MNVQSFRAIFKGKIGKTMITPTIRLRPKMAWIYSISNSVIGEYIEEVQARGLADRAGLRVGDRIIEVNGVNIETNKSRDVVNRIRESLKFRVSEKARARLNIQIYH